jgi:nucleoside-diphosphate-sugar epimerase
VGDFAVHRFDVAKAREILGFSAKVALEEGLDEVVAWLRRES